MANSMSNVPQASIEFGNFVRQYLEMDDRVRALNDSTINPLREHLKRLEPSIISLMAQNQKYIVYFNDDQEMLQIVPKRKKTAKKEKIVERLVKYFNGDVLAAQKCYQFVFKAVDDDVETINADGSVSQGKISLDEFGQPQYRLVRTLTPVGEMQRRQEEESHVQNRTVNNMVRI